MLDSSQLQTTEGTKAGGRKLVEGHHNWAQNATSNSCCCCRRLSGCAIVERRPGVKVLSGIAIRENTHQPPTFVVEVSFSHLSSSLFSNKLKMTHDECEIAYAHVFVYPEEPRNRKHFVPRKIACSHVFSQEDGRGRSPKINGVGPATTHRIHKYTGNVWTIKLCGIIF